MFILVKVCLLITTTPLVLSDKLCLDTKTWQTFFALKVHLIYNLKNLFSIRIKVCLTVTPSGLRPMPNFALI